MDYFDFADIENSQDDNIINYNQIEQGQENIHNIEEMIQTNIEQVKQQEEANRQQQNNQLLKLMEQRTQEHFPQQINTTILSQTKYQERQQFREQNRQKQQNEESKLSTQEQLTLFCNIYKIQILDITYETELLRFQEESSPPTFGYQVGFRNLDMTGGDAIKNILNLDHAVIELGNIVFEINKGTEQAAEYSVCEYEQFKLTKTYNEIYWDQTLKNQTFIPPKILDDILGRSAEWRDAYQWKTHNCHHFVVACLKILQAPWLFKEHKICPCHFKQVQQGHYMFQLADNTLIYVTQMQNIKWKEVPEKPIKFIFVKKENE
ncbi:Hypothetical_protein [Hexamita inflata]|uniref:Hypothetical_protein n=1 Tax=Hexamita inflata TaxID=28002 RepID=A0AA86QRV0_9EUKA|nr:Hypothetical protein HINF_LOCUS45729 [Hexamita inflata]